MACSSLAAEDTMRDDPAVIALVARARDGDQRAWNEFVDRYAPLGWSVRNLYRLSRHDIDDVGQTVWLLLVEQPAISLPRIASGQPDATRSTRHDNRSEDHRSGSKRRAARSVRRAAGSCYQC